jgi:hypothetical protein
MMCYEWLPLKENEGYEIFSQYPHQIRNDKGNILSFFPDKDGYLIVCISGKHQKHHRLVANQFIPKAEGKDQIDHINRIKDDNHINNLRWVDAYENTLNRRGYGKYEYEFIERLGEDAFEIETYNNQNIREGYYYCDGNFYIHTGLNYRKLKICNNGSRGGSVHMTREDGYNISVGIYKFKKEHDLL